jgi:hypothetical protein
VQDKESLITELRKELRVSDEEHRELLNKVNEDGAIRQMRYFHKEFQTSSISKYVMFYFVITRQSLISCLHQINFLGS